MGCSSNNATPPTPAIAPGADIIDPAEVARRLTIDPRIPELVPGFDAPFFQAGLAGYSDAAMRLIARRLGCPYCVTEALLDRTLLAGGRGFAKADLGELHDNVPGGAEDHPLAGQIMGSDPGEMAAAARKMIDRNAHSPSPPGRWGRGERGSYPTLPLGEGTGERDSETCSPRPQTGPGTARLGKQPNRSFAAIDVNLACPVKKIKAKARGGHWLRDPEGAIDILRAVRDAVPPHVPVTVKLRRGSDDSREAEYNFYKIFDAAYDLGLAWVTVHGRTVEQKYVGPSRWDFLRDLVRARPDRLIFGSGDVWGVGDIFRMIEYTGVHAVSVARGCIGDPWVFRQARSLMAGATPAEPTLAEQRAVLEEHYMLSVAVNGERRASHLMRKFGVRFSQRHPDAEAVRRRFIAVASVEDWRAVLDEFYAEPAPACVA